MRKNAQNLLYNSVSSGWRYSQSKKKSGKLCSARNLLVYWPHLTTLYEHDMADGDNIQRYATIGRKVEYSHLLCGFQCFVQGWLNLLGLAVLTL